MFSRTFNKFFGAAVGSLVAFIVLGAQPAFSAIGPFAESAPISQEESAVAATMPNGLILSIERMLQARWAEIEPMSVSTPSASTELMSQKLSALSDLNTFAQTTIDGLIRAAAGAADQSKLEGPLLELLARWNLKITGAMDVLLSY